MMQHNHIQPIITGHIVLKQCFCVMIHSSCNKKMEKDVMKLKLKSTLIFFRSSFKPFSNTLTRTRTNTHTYDSTQWHPRRLPYFLAVSHLESESQDGRLISAVFTVASAKSHRAHQFHKWRVRRRTKSHLACLEVVSNYSHFVVKAKR